MSNQIVQEQARGGFRSNRGGQNGNHKTSRRDQRLNTLSTQNSTRHTVNFEDALDNPSPKDNSENCFICDEPITCYAVSSCNHRTCHLCSLKLRALYKKRNCTEQEKVIFTRDPEKPFQDYKDADIPYIDKKLNVFCEDLEIYEDIGILLSFNCPEINCEERFNGWFDLKRHVKREHKSIKKFLSISILCSLSMNLMITLKKATNKDSKGIRSANFAMHIFTEKMSFIIIAEIYMYYAIFQQHFKKEHYLCLHEECLEKKFIVFRTSIDLKAHEVEVHGSDERRIEINFSYVDSHTRPRSHRRSPERQDGGGGDVVSPSIDSGRQTQIGESSTNDSGYVVSRRVRPPPGFGGLSPEENAGSSDSSPQPTNVIREQSSRVRIEEFPTLRASMEAVVGSNPERTRFDRSSTPTRHNISSQSQTGDVKKREKGKDPMQKLMVEASSSSASSSGRLPVRDEAFPALSVVGLVELLEDETKKRELLSAWNDYKAMESFPALEPSEGSSSVHKPPVQNKSTPRVLVIKSSSTRAGGTRPSGAHVYDKVAAAALKSSTKTNSNSPASPATNAWKDLSQFTESPRASSSVGDSSSSMSTKTIFIKGKPVKLENNNDFPGLSSTSSSTRVVNSESAWGHGGAFSSLTSNHRNDSDADGDNADTENDGKKRKQQKKKQKQVLYYSR
ncbi:17381_t:CDS:2 [Acaulospora colombiana]|uniref:17381_t:CDS:1 n=1 Tax=Acaulospora colombiana TaxID=27376 RepID=A0ACA9KF13_9GLOM|nr:17381_t:CDS:2 [Acaulospora colombiana]